MSELFMFQNTLAKWSDAKLPSLQALSIVLMADLELLVKAGDRDSLCLPRPAKKFWTAINLGQLLSHLVFPCTHW